MSARDKFKNSNMMGLNNESGAETITDLIQNNLEADQDAGEAKPLEKPIEKPENYDQMLKIATELCKGFDFVRVDLYEHAGNVYFGEMTFTPASGMMKFSPDDWDYKLGSLWVTQ